MHGGEKESLYSEFKRLAATGGSGMGLANSLKESPSFERATMNRWNDTFERRNPQPGDGWADRARRYLRSRTADHWLMFAAGVLLGALLA